MEGLKWDSREENQHQAVSSNATGEKSCYRYILRSVTELKVLNGTCHTPCRSQAQRQHRTKL